MNLLLSLIELTVKEEEVKEKESCLSSVFTGKGISYK